MYVYVYSWLYIAVYVCIFLYKSIAWLCIHITVCLCLYMSITVYTKKLYTCIGLYMYVYVSVRLYSDTRAFPRDLLPVASSCFSLPSSILSLIDRN